jgi:methionyl-tRNA formyltransferase
MTNAPRALYFGRFGCPRSEAALAHLKVLGFQTQVVISQEPGAALPAWVHDWRGDWIFCFRSYYILPKSVIDAAAQAAINFHPAPSDFRGRGCLNFALYENSPQYGVTAHVIKAKVDTGAILRCDRFPILPGDGVDSLLQRTHHYLLSAFYDIVDGIASEGRAYVDALLESCDESWTGPLYKLSQLNDLQVLDGGESAEEMVRVIRATHTTAFPTQLALHGQLFELSRKPRP